jgi:hypothetical protein
MVCTESRGDGLGGWSPNDSGAFDSDADDEALECESDTASYDDAALQQHFCPVGGSDCGEHRGAASDTQDSSAEMLENAQVGKPFTSQGLRDKVAI